LDTEAGALQTLGGAAAAGGEPARRGEAASLRAAAGGARARRTRPAGEQQASSGSAAGRLNRAAAPLPQWPAASDIEHQVSILDTVIIGSMDLGFMFVCCKYRLKTYSLVLY
jgi:hypothetical protein